MSKATKVVSKPAASTKKDAGAAVSPLAASKKFVAERRHLVSKKRVSAPRNMYHFVKWPLYIRVQRQRAILKQRIRVPAAVNQFSKTLKKDQASTLFNFLTKYVPETKKQKKERLVKQAASEVKNETKAKDPSTKPCFIKHGLNHITNLIESKRAKLVVIAHDVDPIELVVWLPTLCRKMNVPFCIVKSKSRLGQLVHKKTTTCLAITDVQQADEPVLKQLQDVCLSMFSVFDRKAGGNKLSATTAARVAYVKKMNQERTAALRA